MANDGNLITDETPGIVLGHELLTHGVRKLEDGSPAYGYENKNLRKGRAPRNLGGNGKSFKNDHPKGINNCDQECKDAKESAWMKNENDKGRQAD
jgi:hypothetical protein